ncbi:MAG: hypothetical protein ACRCUS_01740 [Anaerovoracaceae bacterium]
MVQSIVKTGTRKIKNVSTDALGNKSIEEINAEGQVKKIADIGSGE